MELLRYLVLAVYTLSSLLLLLYGLNTYILILLFLRKRGVGEREDAATEARFADRFDHPESLPVVTTQVPLYNEANVAERVIRAVAQFDYPRDKHEIQVLDDSDDETREIVDTVAESLRQQGHWVQVFRREDRTGYKAGALKAAMAEARGEYIAIFDSDFVPRPDFLRRSLPHLWADERCGLVQARWDHLNSEDSRLTKAQAIGIDGHFVIEQTARSRNGLFMNFCGTAGLWRQATIEDAGNWQHDTLTEDLDLSYRAQMRGWRFHYLPSLRVPAELPDNYAAFKSQQFRWAKGSIQTALKLLPQLWSQPHGWLRKLEGTVHLTHYGLHLQMTVLALLILPLMLLFKGQIALYESVLFLSLLIPAALGPSIGYVVCQYYGHPRDWRRRLLRLPFLLVVGFGISLSNSKAVLEALLGRRSGFVRTPKKGQRAIKQYRLEKDWLPRAEVLLALYCLATFLTLLMLGFYALLPFLVIYVLGFGHMGLQGLREAQAA